MKNYIKINNQKIELTDNQVKEIQKSFGLSRIKLSAIAVGDTFKVGDIEFIVLEQSGDTTAVITRDLIENGIRFGDNNNFADYNCTVRKRLEKFMIQLSETIGIENLIEHTVDLTSDDGLKDYGNIRAKISLLTCDLYRRYVHILDKFKPNKWWWLVTAYSTPTHNTDNWVKCVSPIGSVGNLSRCDDYYGGVRPFCILNSNIFVSK